MSKERLGPIGAKWGTPPFSEPWPIPPYDELRVRFNGDVSISATLGDGVAWTVGNTL